MGDRLRGRMDRNLCPVKKKLSRILLGKSVYTGEKLRPACSYKARYTIDLSFFYFKINIFKFPSS